MDRRTYLAIATAAIAGCGQASNPDAASPTEDDPDEATPTETPTSTPTATPTTRPASLAVTDVSVPATVEIGTPVELAITVENAGGTDGSFSSPVEARLGTGDWTSTDVTVETPVPAGESVTETVELPANPYIEPASYRLADADPVARTRFVARELAVGDGHTLPNGIAFSLEAVSFSETYTYEGPDGETTVEPTSGERWLIGTLRAENTGDEPATAPLVSDVAFFRDDHEFAYQHITGNRDRYRGGELTPGEVSKGDVPSDVPSDLTREDLHFEHSDAYDGGEVTVRWSLDE